MTHPLTRWWRRLRGTGVEPQPVLRMRRFLADENGHIEADLEGAPEVLATLYAHLSLLLSKAENYVETGLTIKPAGEVEPYIITVQRGSRPSPHELRERAEAEAQRLREIQPPCEECEDFDPTEVGAVCIQCWNAMVDRHHDIRDLLRIWLTGDCPNHSPECRETHLCQLCFENAAIDFGLEGIPDRSTK